LPFLAVIVKAQDAGGDYYDDDGLTLCWTCGEGYWHLKDGEANDSLKFYGARVGDMPVLMKYREETSILEHGLDYAPIFVAFGSLWVIGSTKD
jgi:hypothetical protein